MSQFKSLGGPCLPCHCIADPKGTWALDAAYEYFDDGLLVIDGVRSTRLG